VPPDPEEEEANGLATRSAFGNQRLDRFSESSNSGASCTGTTRDSSASNQGVDSSGGISVARAGLEPSPMAKHIKVNTIAIEIRRTIMPFPSM
jgi:hypothetical protein